MNHLEIIYPSMDSRPGNHTCTTIRTRRAGDYGHCRAVPIDPDMAWARTSSPAAIGPGPISTGRVIGSGNYIHLYPIIGVLIVDVPRRIVEVIELARRWSLRADSHGLVGLGPARGRVGKVARRWRICRCR